MKPDRTYPDLEALKVSTSEIGASPFELRGELSASSVSFLLLEPTRQDYSWQARESFSPVFSLTRENNHTFKVLGQARLVLANSCVRCLELVDHEIKLDFTLRLLEKRENQREALDFDYNSDYTVEYFSNRQIDLAQILREQIFLALPDYPQCSVGCETFIPLANVDEGKVGKQNPFLKFLEKYHASS